MPRNIVDVRDEERGTRYIVDLDEIVAVQVYERPPSGEAPEVIVTLRHRGETRLYGYLGLHFLHMYEQHVQSP